MSYSRLQYPRTTRARQQSSRKQDQESREEPEAYSLAPVNPSDRLRASRQPPAAAGPAGVQQSHSARAGSWARLECEEEGGRKPSGSSNRSSRHQRLQETRQRRTANYDRLLEEKKEKLMSEQHPQCLGGAQFSPDEQEQVRRQQERQFAINQKYHRLHEKQKREQWQKELRQKEEEEIERKKQRRREQAQVLEEKKRIDDERRRDDVRRKRLEYFENQR